MRRYTLCRVCVCVILDFTEISHTFVEAVDLRGVRGVASSVSPLSSAEMFETRSLVQMRRCRIRYARV